jgi:hypothetical protein
VNIEWRKSSRSNTQGECVEVARFPESIAVRDSKDPAGPRLSFRMTDMRYFLGEVKDGRHDR